MRKKPCRKRTQNELHLFLMCVRVPGVRAACTLRPYCQHTESPFASFALRTISLLLWRSATKLMRTRNCCCFIEGVGSKMKDVEWSRFHEMSRPWVTWVQVYYLQVSQVVGAEQNGYLSYVVTI